MATISNTAGLNFTGLATGINTSNIIEGLTKINNNRIALLKNKQTDFADKQSAFASLQGRLFDLQSKASSLARSVGGAFDGKAATSSDATALSVAAGSSALTGDYSITVQSLAQSQQVLSGNFADPNAALKQGTLAIQVGSGTTATVTLDSRNNTLQGLADAINASGAEVKAAIINDGSASPYRLMLTSTKTGEANTLSITNSLTTGTGADIDPLATTIRAAADAAVSLGSGANAITVKSASNQLSGVIPGVTFNLLKADPSKPLNVSIAGDTAGATKAVQAFVDAFNGVMDFIGQVSSYDKASQKAGLLLGDHGLRSLKDDLASSLSASIPGLSASANRLSSVGLSFDDQGKLELDAGKLQSALSGVSGASSTDLKKLFGVTGQSDNPGVSFLLASDKTKPSGAAPYQVEVTAPATRATIIASGPPASAITVVPANATLQLKLNGLAEVGIEIPTGSFSESELAVLLQSRINAAPEFKNDLVSVDVDSGKFRITTQEFGSGTSVAVVGGSLMADLGFAGTETGAGTDVVGRFVAGGKVEAGAGNGQILIGASGNANTAGLQVRSALTSAGTANLQVNQGLAGRLVQVLSNYLDPIRGKLKGINDGYQRNIDDLGKSIDKQNELLSSKTAELQLRFAEMETAVNNLKGLQTQLASLTISSTTTK